MYWKLILSSIAALGTDLWMPDRWQHRTIVILMLHAVCERLVSSRSSFEVSLQLQKSITYLSCLSSTLLKNTVARSGDESLFWNVEEKFIAVRTSFPFLKILRFCQFFVVFRGCSSLCSFGFWGWTASNFWKLSDVSASIAVAIFRANMYYVYLFTGIVWTAGLCFVLYVQFLLTVGYLVSFRELLTVTRLLSHFVRNNLRSLQLGNMQWAPLMWGKAFPGQTGTDSHAKSDVSWDRPAVPLCSQL